MSDGFKIVLPSQASVTGSFEAVASLYQQILDKAIELLKDNLPPWEVVEAAVRAAYDSYIRPLALPNILDNILCNALVDQVKKIYDQLAAQ